MVHHLPEVIFQQIQTFLTKLDYLYFLNASKCFLELKRNTVYYALTPEKSKEYLDSPHFQDILLSKVENGWKQISLLFGSEVDTFPFINVPIHKIAKAGDLKHNILGQLTNIQNILLYTGFRDVPLLPKLKALTIYNSVQVEPLTNLSHLTSLDIQVLWDEDVTALQNIKHLSLLSCNNIKDFSILGNGKQTSLTLVTCPFLTVVNNFQSVRILTLAACSALEDVSPLHGVYNLSLQSCRRVKDISKLGNHHRLQIYQCSTNLLGYESLKDIPHVELGYCDISDLTPLSNAKSVSLVGCIEISDVSPLKSVKSVILSCFKNSINVSTLHNVQNLELSFRSTDGIDNLSTMKNNRLDISLSSGSIEDFTFVCNIQHFNFRQPLKPILIDQSLKDISGLGRNRSVEIRSCGSITDVSSLAAVLIVTIQGCDGIKNVECLQKVPRLRIF